MNENHATAKAGNTHGVFVTIVSFAKESTELTECTARRIF